MSTAHDYTQDGQVANAPADDFNPDDYSFLPLSATPDAEAIEREAEARQFRDIPAGDHELFVKAIAGRPVAKLRTGFLRGQQVSWESDMVKVRLALVGDPGASCVDMFDLPPRDPRSQEAYLFASKSPEGGNPGFHARKLTHFLSRLGYQIAEGAPLPAAACNLGNWVNRRVHATVEAERQEASGPKLDQRTGLPYPPRMQVKLFSYRPSGSAPQAGGGATQAAQPRAAGQAPPSRQAASPAGRGDRLSHLNL